MLVLVLRGRNTIKFVILIEIMGVFGGLSGVASGRVQEYFRLGLDRDVVAQQVRLIFAAVFLLHELRLFLRKHF